MRCVEGYTKKQVGEVLKSSKEPLQMTIDLIQGIDIIKETKRLIS